MKQTFSSHGKRKICLITTKTCLRTRHTLIAAVGASIGSENSPEKIEFSNIPKPKTANPSRKHTKTNQQHHSTSALNINRNFFRWNFSFVYSIFFGFSQSLINFFNKKHMYVWDFNRILGGQFTINEFKCINSQQIKWKKIRSPLLKLVSFFLKSRNEKNKTPSQQIQQTKFTTTHNKRKSLTFPSIYLEFENICPFSAKMKIIFVSS